MSKWILLDLIGSDSIGSYFLELVNFSYCWDLIVLMYKWILLEVVNLSYCWDLIVLMTK